MVFSVREGGWSSSEYVMKIDQSNLNIKQNFKSYIVIFQEKKISDSYLSLNDLKW